MYTHFKYDFQVYVIIPEVEIRYLIVTIKHCYKVKPIYYYI